MPCRLPKMTISVPDRPGFNNKIRRTCAESSSHGAKGDVSVRFWGPVDKYKRDVAPRSCTNLINNYI